MSFLDLLNKPLEVVREACSTEGCGTEACGNESCKEEACKKEGCGTEACGNESCKEEACKKEGCGTEACGDESCEEGACDAEGYDTESGSLMYPKHRAETMNSLKRLRDTKDAETETRKEIRDEMKRRKAREMDPQRRKDEFKRANERYMASNRLKEKDPYAMESDDEYDNDFDDEEYDRDDIDAAMDEMDIEDELQGMSDDEIDDLANSLLSSEIDDLSGDDDPVDLTPDEERDADDMMAVAATMGVIQNELNAQEKATLIESAADLRIAVDEGFLMESDLKALEESVEPVMEATFAPKTKVKFSLKDREKQLYAIAINACARSHNDPDYYGLQKLNRLRRIKRAKLEKKYHAEAVQRMKVYIKRLKSSKSSILSGIGKKLSK